MYKKYNFEHQTIVQVVLHGVFLLSMPALVSGAETFATFMTRINGILLLLIPLVLIAMFIAFIGSGVSLLMNSGDQKSRSGAKEKLFWGVLVLFVSVSVWGIVKLLFSELLQ